MNSLLFGPILHRHKHGSVLPKSLAQVSQPEKFEVYKCLL